MMKALLSVILTIPLASCGFESDENATVAGSGAGTNPAMTMALESADDLPACNDLNENQLVYVKSETSFYECDGGDWEEIETAESSLSVAKIWEFNEPATPSSPNVAEGISHFFLYITNIEIVEFTNNQSLISVNGAARVTSIHPWDWGKAFFHDPDHGDKFSHNITFGAGYEIVYKITPGSPPAFSATTDTDSDLSNNTWTDFNLEKAD